MGGGVGKLFKAGSQPMNASVQYNYNLDKPTTGADWQVKFVVQFLFKKK